MSEVVDFSNALIIKPTKQQLKEMIDDGRSDDRSPWERSVAERYRSAKDSSLIYTTHPCGCSEIEGNGKVVVCHLHRDEELPHGS